MARPEHRTNLQFIFDCLYRNLGIMDHAHGFKTDGYLVVPGRDPRAVKVDMPAVYQQKCAAVSLKFVNKLKDHKKSLHGITWWDAQVDIQILRSLTTTDEAAGRTIEDLELETHDDIERLIGRDRGFAEAAPIVVANGLAASPQQTYRSPKPEITALDFIGIYHPALQTFPDALLLARLKFSYSERLTTS